MGPTPISLVDNTMHSEDVVLQDRWFADLDPKAVGSHLLLGKRNSTPISIGSFNHLKIHPQTLPQMAQHPTMVSTVGSLPSASEHRRLDRTLSEPIRSQLQPQLSPTAAGLDGRVGPATSSSRYKTELCRPFAETGFCKYGEKCQFAHGGPELRNMPRHPKYKTELCRTFHTTGLCGYGTRCHFIHNAEERRGASQSHASLTPTSSLGLPFSMLNSDDESNGNSMGHTPPSSIHGSPTSQVGTFFDENFSLSFSGSDDQQFGFIGMDTPPETPVESLAGDMDNLSLSPDLSNSPPPTHSNMGSFANHGSFQSYRDLLFRLPIFETLTEVQ